MKTLHRVIITILLLTSPALASSPCFTAAGIDRHQKVFVVDHDGVKTFVTSQGHYTKPILSDDHCTVAWLWISQITNLGQKIEVWRQLSWIRNGKIHKYATDAFIRDIWFVEKGRKIGLNIGALHFAGENLLLDADSGEILETFEDRYKLEKPVPSWVQE